MPGTIFDAVLGRFFSDGAELELGAGVDCKNGIVAARNNATRRIDVSPDKPRIWRESYAYEGDATAVATGAGTVDLALDGANTTIPIGDVVDVGHAVELTCRVWLTRQNGTIAYRDELRFALYRETASSEIHLLDLGTNGGDVIGTGSQSLTLTGANSAMDYTISASYGGTLGIAVEQHATQTRVARAALWVGAAWDVPVVLS
jgi:hypothetical protein